MISVDISLTDRVRVHSRYDLQDEIYLYLM